MIKNLWNWLFKKPLKEEEVKAIALELCKQLDIKHEGMQSVSYEYKKRRYSLEVYCMQGLYPKDEEIPKSFKNLIVRTIRLANPCKSLGYNREEKKAA